ncbi:major facilitator superfamily domain-containing protein [Apodospora peruviana]|uniref:Major facilitator superfamily domain-containing protein n=1 Tax=Apodospora peruviana TaxID=516989 RepID=A0AAE0I098_9PEZI|nr:major facilitator superfamily domain-containing protein [Apodospora peruviana]
MSTENPEKHNHQHRQPESEPELASEKIDTSSTIASASGSSISSQLSMREKLESDLDLEQGGGAYFTPIQTTHSTAADGGAATPNGKRRTSRDTFRSGSLRRERSNNGWGVDDLENDDENDEEVESRRPTSAAAAADAQTTNDDEKDPFEVGWEGGDSDPVNPRSMPLWRKWTIIGITSFGSFCVTNASASYTATYGPMDAEFGNSRLVATIGLSTFVLGIALGPFWSPLAEFYGRRPIYLCSFAAFMIFLVPSAVARNIQTMIVARFFQGLAGSAFLSVSGGTVGDLFTRDTMQAPMAVFAVAPFVGPATGPLLGGLITYFTAGLWRWLHYVLLIWSASLLVGIALFVPETYHPVLLKCKAQKLRKTTNNPLYKAPLEKSEKSITRTVSYSLLRPFQLLVLEPMCLILDVYSAILLGVLYLFFGAFPLVFMNNHGFKLWQVGLTFMGLLVASITATLSTPIWRLVRERLVEKRRLATGIVKDEPEDQLPPVICGAPLITAGLFMFGFTTYPWVHWIVPIIGSGIFGIGTMLAFTGIFTFLVDAYPRYAASALAGNAFVRCSFAAIFPLFGIQMYERLGYQWATALLGFLTLAMLPFPYIFFVFGKRIRARSRFAATS